MAESPYTLPLVVAAALAGALAFHGYRNRCADGVFAFSILMAASAFWTIGYAIELSSTTLDAILFWTNLEYIGIVIVPVAALAFLAGYTGHGEWFTRRRVAVLAAEPAIALLLCWTSSWHGLFRADAQLIVVDGQTHVVKTYGPLFWVHSAYAYALLFVGVFSVIRFLASTSKIYRRQAYAILAGVLIPVAANLLYLSRLSPYPYLDLTPFSFVAMGIVGAWGLFRYGFLDIVPFARGTVVDEMTDGVLVANKDDRIVDVNPSALSFLGTTTDESIGRKTADIIPELESFSVGDVREVSRGDQTELRIFEIERTPLVDGRDRSWGSVVLIHDITLRKRGEEEQIRTQRLRAIGELSAGISHNLNNILTGILAPADILLEKARDPDDRRELERVVGAAIRARDLVRRLNDVVRDAGEERISGVDVTDVINAAVLAARPKIKDEPESFGWRIETKLDLSSGCIASATKLGLHNVLLNLLFNAADAVTATERREPGGLITIATERTADEVVIRVEDDGIGMSANVKRRVFEPFFTTKANVGTGFGLSTAYGTVRRWGGRIDVQSSLGSGTLLTITLKLWRGTPTLDSDGKATEEPIAVTPARILIVEDEDLVCGVIGGPLERAGHQVYVASDGREAIELMHENELDVALIDLGIPYISGDRVAITLKQYDPRISTILMTGWDLDEGDPRLGAFDFRVQKPIELAQLNRTLAHAIDLTLSQTARPAGG